MSANGESGASRTSVERTSERELVVARTFDAPARIVFEAWTRPELFQRWWAPKSFGVTFVSAEMDVRTGGTYRLMLGHPSREQPMAFFGGDSNIIFSTRKRELGGMLAVRPHLNRCNRDGCHSSST